MVCVSNLSAGITGLTDGAGSPEVSARLTILSGALLRSCVCLGLAFGGFIISGYIMGTYLFLTLVLRPLIDRWPLWTSRPTRRLASVGGGSFAF